MSIDAQEWEPTRETKQSYQIERVFKRHAECIIRAFATPANTSAKKFMHMRG